MATDIGPKIGIDGEAEFRREIKKISESLKTLGTEMDVVTSEFVGNERSVEALTAQNQVLDKTVEKLNERLLKQREMLEQATAAFGEADPRTEKWQQTVNRTTAELNRAEAQIKQNTTAIENIDKAEESAAGSTDVMDQALQGLGLTLTLDVATAIGMAVNAVKALIDVFADAVIESSKAADEILTLSTNYGIATDKLQEYQYMSELADTSVDTITGSISYLTRAMGQAQDGSGEAAEAFRFLNVRIKDADGTLRDATDVFDDVIMSLGYVRDETQRNIIMQTLFGRSGMELNSLIALGADGYRELAEEAHNYGAVLSEEELAVLGKVDDQFQRLDQAMDIAYKRMALELAPEVIELTQKLIDLALATDWEQVGRVASNVLRTVADVIVPVIENLTALGNVILDVTEYITFLLEKWNDFRGFVGQFSTANLIGSGISLANLAFSPAQAQATPAASGGGTVQLTGDVYLDGTKVGRSSYRGVMSEAQRLGGTMISR